MNRSESLTQAVPKASRKGYRNSCFTIRPVTALALVLTTATATAKALSLITADRRAPRARTSADLDPSTNVTVTSLRREAAQVDDDPPPVAKFTATIGITANTHDELHHRVVAVGRNWRHFITRYESVDAVRTTDGTTSVQLEHTNPEQTPEGFAAELEAWYERRQARWKASS